MRLDQESPQLAAREYVNKQFTVLNSSDVIQAGDLYCNRTPDNIDKFISGLKNLNEFTKTRSAGDLVSDHPDRLYIRIFN